MKKVKFPRNAIRDPNTLSRLRAENKPVYVVMPFDTGTGPFKIILDNNWFEHLNLIEIELWAPFRYLVQDNCYIPIYEERNGYLFENYWHAYRYALRKKGDLSD